MTDRLGNTTRLEWSGNLLARVTDPLGATTTRTYEPGPIRGLLATETGPYGATASRTYDEIGQLARLVDATGAVTLAAWSPLGWPAGFDRQTAAGESVLVQETDTNAMGWPVTLRERYAGQPIGSPFTTTWRHSPTGTPESVTDPLGGLTTFDYDPDLMLTRVTYPATAAPGDRTVYHYDRENQLAGIDYGAGVTEGFAADPLGRPARYTDPNGSIWQISYAPSGDNLVQTITLPANHPDTGQPLTNAVAVDPLGRPAEFTDTAGGVTSFDYATVPIAGTDTFGLRITTTFPASGGSDPLTRSQTYDAVGRLAASVNEDGKLTAYSYAPASSVPDPPVGAVVAVTTTRPSGVTELNLFDGAGQLIQVRRSDGSAQRFASRGYDPLGRVVAASLRGGPEEITATCGYAWADGAVVASVALAGTAGPVLDYDPLGQLVAARDRAGQSVRYGYTPAGLLATFTNSRGQEVGYSHDAAGRLTTITLPDGPSPIEHVLDGNGNRVQTLVAGATAITRTFDTLNRLTSRTAGAATVGFGYDALGGLAGLRYPAPPGQSPPEVSYERDALGRLTSVTDWAQRETTYGYRPSGGLSWQQSPNGLRTEAGYDDDGRLTSLTSTSHGLVVARASYGYDAFDAPVTINELLPAPAVPVAGTRTFSYDGARLTAVDGVALSYDEDGDVLTAPGLAGQLGYNIFGELVGAGPVTVTRDADGLPTAIAGAGPATTLVHDPGGYANPWRDQADFLRATRTVGWQPLPMGGAALTPVLVSAAGGGDAGAIGGGEGPPAALAATSPAWSAPLAALDRRLTETTGGQRTSYVHGVGLVGAERADGTFASYVFDANGNTLALALPDGTLTDRQAYDAFGAAVGAGPPAQPFGLAGRLGVASDIGGLASMRARTYAPGLLRFTSQDFLLGVLSEPDSLNRYAYLRGAPLLRADPLGLDGFPLWGKILAGVGGAIVVGGLIVGGLYAGGVIGGAGAGGGMVTGVGLGVGGGASATGTLASTAARTGGQFGWRQVGRQLIRRRRWGGNRPEVYELETLVDHTKAD